jgi:hypothetical protein
MSRPPIVLRMNGLHSSSIVSVYCSTEPAPSWKASSRQADQEIPRLLYNPRIHYPVRKSPPPDSIMSHMNPVRDLPQTFLMIHFNISVYAYIFQEASFLHVFHLVYCTCRRSQWPRGLRHELSSPAQTLGSWVRIPPEACVYPAFMLPCVQAAVKTLCPQKLALTSATKRRSLGRYSSRAD